MNDGEIVVVGSLNMDLVVPVARHPKPGETIIGGDLQHFHGGKGANQAVAAARLGGRVRMVGRVGADAYGAELKRGLEAEGIETADVAETDAPTGVALILALAKTARTPSSSPPGPTPACGRKT